MAGFGMMNEAYFKSKTDLLQWVNTFLDVNIAKVEQCCTGALYCNIWDAVHPRTIAMRKVKFDAKTEPEYVGNWKVLQQGFDRAGVNKHIYVERLIKGRYQDNLEFLQWMFQYVHNTFQGDADCCNEGAVEARKKGKGGKQFTGSAGQTKKRAVTRGKGKENAGGARPTSAARSKAPGRVSSLQRTLRGSGGSATVKRQLEELRHENSDLRSSQDALQAKLDKLQRDHDELSAVAKDIEKERDFYFNKVLAVESISKKHDDQEMLLLQSIYNILYQADGDEDAAEPAGAEAAPDSAGAATDGQDGMSLGAALGLA